SRNELDEVLAKVMPLAKSPNLLLALADKVDHDSEQIASESVVGTLLGQELRFGKEEPWSLHCRKLLLLRAVELTRKKNAAGEVAAILRNLYREQGLLLGVPPDRLDKMSQPSHVIEIVIQHVADQLGRQKLGKEDQEFIGRVPAQLRVAEFVAQHDLEHT